MPDGPIPNAYRHDDHVVTADAPVTLVFAQSPRALVVARDVLICAVCALIIGVAIIAAVAATRAGNALGQLTTTTSSTAPAPPVCYIDPADPSCPPGFDPNGG